MGIEQEVTYYSEKMVALAAVREASELCKTVQQELDPTGLQKKDRSPVTIADFGSQALVCSRLKSAYPADSIIAEESAEVLRDPQNSEVRDQVIARVRALRPDAVGADILDWIDFGGNKDHAERYWTLDPIDGTKGFLRKDQYAVALALIVEGTVVVAALACPNLTLNSFPDHKGVVVVAVKGYGTEVMCLSTMQKLGDAKVSTIKHPAEVRFSESVEAAHTSHSNSQKVAQLMGIPGRSVKLDSQAKYAVVAGGDAEIYMRLPSARRYVENIWDHAAGMLVVEEAGGVVTDIHGKPLSFKFGHHLKDNRGVIVSNAHVHDTLLDAIQEAGVE